MRVWLLAACSTCLLGGCLLRPSGPALPVGGSIVRDQLVIYSDFELPQRHRLIEDLVALRGDISQTLKLPTSDEPIHVYLFDNRRRYREFMKKHYEEFVERRAFFVQNDTTLKVYAFWGERVAEDLRHEVAHGYLHSVVPNIPLWLDEGLAEYFEVTRGRRGLNDGHIDLLWKRFADDEWEPDLHRLEKLVYAADMTQLDYAESWLWVHLLLQSTPKRIEALQQHLARLHKTGSTPPLSQRVESQEPSANRVVIQHLKSLARRP